MVSTFCSLSCRLVLSLVILSAFAAWAQSSLDEVHIEPRTGLGMTALAPDPAGGLTSGSVLHAGVELVMVPVTITDALNRPVVGLDQQNFQVFENKKPQEIKHFSSDDAPVSIGIVLDTSGSMGDKLARAREAVAQFCETANPQDEFFMITFADSPRLATSFTMRTDEIDTDLLTARSKGRTALLDAIYMGIREMRNARYVRKALLIISDGGDNHSRYSERDVNAAIREADVMVYAVGTYDSYFSSQEERLGPALLSSIAGISGGHAFTLTNVNELPDVTRAIGTQLRHQYMLAYAPQTRPRDGKWHKISVKLRLPKKVHAYLLHVEARAGYYASAAR